MKRAVFSLVLLATCAGCVDLAGAAIDAGFRKALDHGSHPLYEHKSYGEHFADALLDEERPEVEVDVEVHERRR
jgi:hypothetical protein